MGLRVSVAKPSNEIFNSYEPGGSTKNRNSPTASVVPLRSIPVSMFVRTTAAPATTAPVESVTVPLTLPEDICACENAELVTNKIARAASQSTAASLTRIMKFRNGFKGTLHF